MSEKIILPWNYDYTIKIYMSVYSKNMAIAESNCIVTSKKSSVVFWESVYNSIVSQCNKLGIDIHSVQFSESVSEYIDCIENYDAVLREKLTVNYIRCCELAKTEFEQDVIEKSKNDFGTRYAYSRWLQRFAGERTATDIFLTEVVESDSDNVKNIVPKAQEYKLFFQEAKKQIQEKLKEFETKRNNIILEHNKRIAEERARYEKEKRKREEAELAEKKRLEEREIRRKSFEKIASEIMPVEGKTLDNQQIDCIIDESRNALVIAGAGSGKTTTIIGKVKFLLHTNKCKADEILLLSFTKKSADEMKQRIKTETGIDMDVSTFHKLGLDTITRVEGKKPTVYSKSLQFFAREDMKKYLDNKYYREELLKYCWLAPPRARSIFDFKTREEMFEYNGSTPTVTIQGEYVKSRCELEIANFLFRNRIRYAYEKPYEFNTADKHYSGYKPDFYLEDYGIYIEFFAIDKNGNVPKWFSSRNGKSARQAYHDSIEWKRRTHRQNCTKMIEVSYADKQDNRLLETLSDKLTACGVKLCPMNDEELYQRAKVNNGYAFQNVSEIIGTIISLVKANGYTYEYFESINKLQSNESIIKLAKPIARDYEQMLKDTKQIDFNDMIYRAAKYYHFGTAAHKYKYVIVDEYQDISKARCNLLKEMRSQNDFSLFCVGDDWQSIYRFAGSDVGYMLDFEKIWGETEKYKIETTYRFPREILDISGRFIMNNPAQIKKQLKTANKSIGKVGLIYGENNALPEKLADKLRELPPNSTVFFIGRYTDDKSILSYKNTPFSVTFNNVDNKYSVKLADRPDLQIEFLTAHKSKGLQADYVFILNNKHRGKGFPSRIHNEPVINFLLRKSDNFSFSEERRLFYVALTRAKYEAWLLVENNNSSVFINELRNHLL